MKQVTGYQCDYCRAFYVTPAEAEVCEKRCLAVLAKNTHLKIFDKNKQPINLDETLTTITESVCYVLVETAADLEVLRYVAPSISWAIHEPGLHFWDEEAATWVNLTIKIPRYEAALNGFPIIFKKGIDKSI